MSSVRWSLAAEFVSRLGLPIVLLVLARLLTPDDFGIVTAATMVISFSQILWEAGMGKALIQRRDGIDEAATLAFWINLCLAVAVAVVLLAAAHAIATSVFGDERVADVLRVMTIAVLLGAAGAVPIALLRRAMMFRRLFWINLSTSLLPPLAAIPLALGGAGYWSLVIGGIVGQALWTLALWRAARWSLRPGVPLAHARELLRFGGWSSLSALLAWGFLWADSLIIGIFLGSRELGVYRTGSLLAVTTFVALFSPLMPVLYSHFSTLQDNPARLREAWSRAVRVIGLASIPSSFALAALSGAVEYTLFDESWRGIGLVIAFVSLAQGFAWLVGAHGEAYRAVGKPQLETWAMLAGFAVYVPAYVISAQIGLAEFLWTRFVVTFWGIACHVYCARRAIGLRFRPLMGYVAALVLASSPILWLRALDWTEPWRELAPRALVPWVLFVGALALVVRHAASEEFRLLLAVVKRRT